MRPSLVFASIIAAISSTALTCQAQEAGDPVQGLALARQICAECHAVDMSRGGSPNPASPRFEAIANVAGMTALALNVALQTSHRSMPNLVLDQDQRRNVIAYILSLR